MTLRIRRGPGAKPARGKPPESKPAALSASVPGSLSAEPAEQRIRRAERLGHSLAGLAAPRISTRVGLSQPEPGPGVQRAISVQNVDYDPVGNAFRHGIVTQAAFYTALGNAIQASNSFGDGHKNHRTNVLNAVAAHDFAQPDVVQLTNAIVVAIQGEYATRGNPVLGGRVAALIGLVRDNLVANIQADPVHPMTAGERGAFDVLAQSAGVALSRAKGTPSTIPYGNLPGTVGGEVDGRLGQIRGERALWNVAAIGPEYTLPNHEFSREIATRQRNFNYQGNHTNNAGWLPAVAAPADLVTPIGYAIYDQATPNLQPRLLRADVLTGMDYATHGGQGRRNRYRNQYEHLRRPHLAALTDANVKLSAMAALCGGVSAYIEFSMAHNISRLLYDPVNDRAYITAHYKWRQGYNPFFEVTGFPAV